jgi:hypothetical protein
MTSISIVYTSLGFVIAADGRCTCADPASNQSRATDQAQKIFPIKDKALAYASSGFAFTDDGRFDLVQETSSASLSLSDLNFSSFDRYFDEFCHIVRRAFRAAVTDGRIDKFPSNEHLPLKDRNRICRVYFAGYFNKEPIWTISSFFHDEANRITFRPEWIGLMPGRALYMGSDIIHKRMFIEPDQRFAQYAKRLMQDSSIDDAVESARGFIEACSSPLAAELDPICKSIGGHIHIAEVTSSHGFQWRIPPISLNEKAD